jgi:hypothetical protein
LQANAFFQATLFIKKKGWWWESFNLPISRRWPWRRTTHTS